MKSLLVLAFVLLASPALAQSASCVGGTPTTTCALTWADGDGTLVVPSGVAVTDCDVRFYQGATIAGGLIGVPGAALTFNVPRLTTLPLARVVESDCRNTEGVGAKTYALVTFPDGRVPAAPTLR